LVCKGAFAIWRNAGFGVEPEPARRRYPSLYNGDTLPT